ncbi:hypothetical protein EP12_10565 [Alteromonas australica]|nr:hypothetical protein EP12_10565 [Alteromonas australica]
MTTVAKGRYTSAPVSTLIGMGTNTRLAANAAINIGRNRVSALSIIERTNSPVSSSICLI